MATAFVSHGRKAQFRNTKLLNFQKQNSNRTNRYISPSFGYNVELIHSVVVPSEIPQILYLKSDINC